MQDADPIDERVGAAPTLWHLCWQAAVGRDFFAHPALYARVRERLIQAHSSRTGCC